MFSKMAKAREAATIANAVEPRAESAYYDQSSDSEALLRSPLALPQASADRIVINLKSEWGDIQFSTRFSPRFGRCFP